MLHKTKFLSLLIHLEKKFIFNDHPLNCIFSHIIQILMRILPIFAYAHI